MANSLEGMEFVSDVTHARLLAAATCESGVWSNAPPCSSLGVRMDNRTIILYIAVGLYLGYLSTSPTFVITVEPLWVLALPMAFAASGVRVATTATTPSMTSSIVPCLCS